MLGDVTEGVVDVVSGTVNSDKSKQTAGIEKIVDTGVTYGKGVVKGTGNMIKNSAETIGAILDGDTDKAIKIGKEVAKTVAIGMAGIGVADIIGGIDIDDMDSVVEVDDVVDVDDVPEYDIDDIADPDTIYENYAINHIDDIDTPEADVELVENENMHYVTPHERELPDGRVIWVDGDGNTAVDRDTGWYQTNPDYRTTE